MLCIYFCIEYVMFFYFSFLNGGKKKLCKKIKFTWFLEYKLVLIYRLVQIVELLILVCSP